MGSSDIARQYHRQTVHERESLGGRHAAMPDFAPMDPANRPAPFKRYPGLTPQPLPERPPSSDMRATDVLSGGSAPAAASIDTGTLARLLFSSVGVTRVMGRRGARTYFRTAPSAGNLHPLETYLASGPVDGLGAGLYHFAPDVFGLERLREGEHRPHLAGAAAAPAVASSPAALVITGIPWRTSWKYAQRGWRHLFWDAGTMLANLLAVADAHGIDVQVLLAFRDTALCDLLGIDGVSELPLAVVRVGTPAGEPSSAGSPHMAEPAELPALEEDATAIAPAPMELSLVTEAQRAGDLHDREEVERWRAVRPDGLAQTASPPAPPTDPPEEPVEEVVLRRGSTRTMRHETVALDLLTWGMATAQHAPLDAVPQGSTLLTYGLSVHAVAGVEPGLYGWAGGELWQCRREPEGEARLRATRLCLDQPLGGDSAYTVFANCPLDGVLDAYGDRGYRAAQLEAGMVVGRLQLAAFALGFGGTGLTFYDDEVAAAFDTEAVCMLVASIGVPAYRSRRGGEPGTPTELAGFGPAPARFVPGVRRAGD